MWMTKSKTGRHADSNRNRTKKRTLRVKHPRGPMIVDIWEPDHAEVEAQTPILLIHGWGGSGSYWGSTAQALAPHAQVIVPDLLGTGRSQPVAQPQNMYDQVDSLADLLNALKIDKVQIIGHSMGSAMSLLLNDSWDGEIERLVLTSMCFFLTADQVKTYRSVMKVMEQTMRFRSPWMANMPGMSRMLGARYFHKMPEDTGLLQQGLVDYLELDFETAIACADNAADDAIREAGQRVSCPTLLIACRQDQVMPVENVNYTSEQIPNCRVEWIDQCGHIPMVEQPEQYMALINDFLKI